MILSRYLVKEVLLNTAAVTLILVLVGITNQFVVYLSRAAAGELPVALVLEVVALNIPFLLSFLLSFGFFLGVLLAYGRLYTEAEMTVMFACGFSVSRLVWTTLAAGTGVAVISALLTLWTTPASMSRLEVMLAQVKSDVLTNFITAGRFQSWGDGRYVVYIADVDEDTKAVKQVFIAEQPESTTEDDKNDRLSVLTAESGMMQEDPESGAEYMVLSDGKRYLGAPGSPEYNLMTFAEYGVRLPSNELNVRDRDRARTTASLIGSDDPEHQSELQWRFTLPLSILVLSILAVPLSRVAPRKGKFSTLFPAIIVILVYTNALMLTRNWVESGWMNPWVGLLWPHVIALTLAGILIGKQTLWFKRLRSAL